MNRIQHDLQPGTPAWHAFRLEHQGASEAAAMLGLSPYMKRSELLRMKHSSLPREFSEWVQAHVLDKGHAVEALAMPHIEALIGESLYPAVYSLGKLSASCDGITIDETKAAEHKQWSLRLAEIVGAGQVPEEHMPQCQQVMLVSGAARCLLVVSDGTPENMVSVWVHADPEWHQRIIDGWTQFDRDLATYTPPPIAEPATAAPMESLPSVSVRMDGALTVASNLPAFAQALKAFVAKMPTRPATDDEFATTDAACKALKRAEEALDATEASALASITDVEEMRRAVADCRKLARDTRLAAEKLVERRKVEIKEQAVLAARRALDDHIATLNAELAPMALRPVAADFAGAIKGLRSIASMQDALDTTLAGAKIAADAQARQIRRNVDAFRKMADGLEFLFSDLGQIIHKEHDDFGALVHVRINAHKAAEAEKEAKRQTDEAARIAAAEQRAREQEAARIAEAQRQAAAAVEAAKQPAAPAFPGTDDARTIADVDAHIKAANTAPAAPTPQPPPWLQEGAPQDATLSLGAICGRLGFTVGGDFLRTALHISPAKTDKRAMLYTEQQFAAICRQLQTHINAVAEMHAAEATA